MGGENGNLMAWNILCRFIDLPKGGVVRRAAYKNIFYYKIEKTYIVIYLNKLSSPNASLNLIFSFISVHLLVIFLEKCNKLLNIRDKFIFFRPYYQFLTQYRDKTIIFVLFFVLDMLQFTQSTT